MVRRCTPPTSSAGRSATCSSAASPADWDLASNALPERLVDTFPGAVYENRFGTVAVRRDGRDVRDHDVPHRPRLRRLPPAASRRVRRHDRARPGAPRLHGQRDGLGRPAGRAAGARRPVRRHGRRREPAPAGRRRTRGPLRGGRPADGPRGPTRRDARLRDRTVGRWPRSRRGPTWSRHLSGERIAAELDKLLGIARPSIGLRLLSDTGLLAGISPELAAQRGIAQNKVAGRGPVGPHAALGRRCLRRPADRPAGGPAPRHRQARDVRRWTVRRPRRRRRRPGRRVARASALPASGPRPGRRARPPAHVRLRADVVGRGRPPVHRQDGIDRRRGARRAPRAAGSGQRRVRAAGRRRAARRAPRIGSPPSRPPSWCSIGRAWPSTGTI